MFRRISHTISKEATAYPGAAVVTTQLVHTAGVDCDWTEWRYTLPNHFGTHYDAPNHHFSTGKKIAELPLEQFIFEKPYILDIEKGCNELITVDDLKDYRDEIAMCDALFLRTGFWRFYNQPEIYARQNPGVSSEAARWLNESFKNLKCVVLDFISLQANCNVPDGVIAHKWLLGQYSDNMICIIEDADLGGLSNNTLIRVFAIPLFVAGIDSAQVTMIAEIKD